MEGALQQAIDFGGYLGEADAFGIEQPPTRAIRDPDGLIDWEHDIETVSEST